MAMFLDFYAELFASYPWSFANLPEEDRADAEIVMLAGRTDVTNLHHASRVLTSDANFMRRVVLEFGPSTLVYGDLALTANRDFMWGLLPVSAWVFQSASWQLRNDKTFVLEAVRWFLEALLYATGLMQADREVAEVAFANPDERDGFWAMGGCMAATS